MPGDTSASSRGGGGVGGVIASEIAEIGGNVRRPRRDVNYKFFVHYSPCIYREKLSLEKGSSLQLSQHKRATLHKKSWPLCLRQELTVFLIVSHWTSWSSWMSHRVPSIQPKFWKILVRNQMEQIILVRRECLGPLLKVEVCVAERLTPRTPDLEVWGSSLAHHIVSLDKELYSTLSSHRCINGYQWRTAGG